MKNFAFIALFTVAFSSVAHAKATAKDGWTAYEHGHYDEAKTILEPLAKHGDTEAMLTLSLMHSSGKGYPESREQGCYWLVKAAEAGDATAQFLSADCKNSLTAKDYAEHKLKRKLKPSK